MRNITAPVGRNSENRTSDVMIIQQLLNYRVYDLHMQPLRLDGMPSEELYETIATFQHKVLNVRRPDGIVDPGRRTFKRLSRMTLAQRAEFDQDWIVPSAPKWIDVAATQLGVCELKGARANSSTVLQYLATVPALKTCDITIKGKTYKCSDVDESSWCGCFVNWCLLQAGYPGHTGILAARAKEWKSYGIDLRGEPRYGCIVTMYAKINGKGYNHVGFYMGHRNGRMVVLGGNQEGRVKVLGGDPENRGRPGAKVCVSEFSGWEPKGYMWPTMADEDD